ncbi:MAG: hydantoinase/oxoprolinase family protein [Anaerolineales bacterium]|nr:hydantoinase/oxoprolinase family protein [Anaerolineales bacterium]
MNPPKPALQIGIDIGGTFTDFVVYDPANTELTSFKLPSTPDDPAQAVLAGLESLRARSPDWPRACRIIHGSTVATNALLERKGARCALITTRGLKDVLQIGRQNRPALYDLTVSLPEPLIPAERRYEVTERIGPHGQIITPLDWQAVLELVTELKEQSIESVAVVLLFSFTNPTHEHRLSEGLQQAGLLVSASAEILPEFREYERTSTTAVNAYVTPVLARYLGVLEAALLQPEQQTRPSAGPAVHLQVMQSNGGCISLPEASRAGVRCILSGPAGGVVGSQFAARLAQPDGQPGQALRLLTFDMGGTSTDVALIQGQPQITTDAQVGGYPIRVPMLDIHTIGAGGGSIAWIDAGGSLRVGPESAGAQPGPACYGHGEQPTVTDANLYLGRLRPESFLDGQLPLYPQRSERTIAALGEKLGLETTRTALGIIEVANAHMEHALRVISVERGFDPRQFTLFSFGGAGGLHATSLARRLRIPKVLISPYAATLSAFGMLAADVVKDYTRTVMLPGNSDYARLNHSLQEMMTTAQIELQAEGFNPEQTVLEPALDMRYRGQSYELAIPFDVQFITHFHQAHQQAYGYAHPNQELEIVNLRVRATGLVPSPSLQPKPDQGPDPAPALIATYPVHLAEGQSKAPFYRAADLQPGNQLSGPAIILYPDTTILLETQDQAYLDGFGNLHILVTPSKKAQTHV